MEFWIKNYQITRVLHRTPLLMVYQGVDTITGKPVRVSEYFDQQICVRRKDNTIGVQNTVAERYQEDLMRFASQARVLEAIEQDSIVRPMDILYENGTVYIVQEIGNWILFESFARQHNLNQEERLALFLPLTEELDQLAANDIFFQLNPSVVYIHPETEKLIADVILEPRVRFTESRRGMINVLYNGITGMPFPQGQTLASTCQLMQQLNMGHCEPRNFFELYALFDESLKVPISSEPIINRGPIPPNNQGTMPPINPMQQQNAGNFQSDGSFQDGGNGKKSFVWVLVVIIILIGCGIFVAMMAGLASMGNQLSDQLENASTTVTVEEAQITEPVPSADAITEDAITAQEMEEDYIAYATTLDEDERIRYDQAVVIDGDTVIYRYWNQGWHLAMEQDGEQTILASNVFPSSLTVDNDKIYYSDAFQENAVYSIAKTGGEPTQILDQPVYTFTVVDNVIYYANVNHQGNLYQKSVTRDDMINVVPLRVFDIQKDANKQQIYFLNEEENLYQYDIDSMNYQLMNTDGGNEQIHIDGNDIFFLQEQGNLVQKNQQDTDEDVVDQDVIQRYDVKDGIIFYVDEEGTMFRQNIQTGENSEIKKNMNAYAIAVLDENTVYFYGNETEGRGQLLLWTKDNGTRPIDQGKGDFDYQPLDEETLKTLQVEEAYGTTVENLIQGSAFVQDEQGNVYFVDIGEIRGGNGIYDIYNATYRYADEKSTKVSSNSLGKGLFYYDGELYYTNYTSGIEAQSTTTGEVRVVNTLEATTIFPYKEKIYASNNKGDLFVMDFSGENESKLLTEEVDSFFVYEDKVYFHPQSDQDEVYWCDLDGKNKRKLFQFDDIDYITASNKKLYFIADIKKAELEDRSNQSVTTLCSADLDGTNVKEIASIGGSVQGTPYLYREWFYFIQDDVRDMQVNRMYLDGTAIESVLNLTTDSGVFNILDDKIYFRSGDTMDYSAARCDLNGDDPVSLFQNQ